MAEVSDLSYKKTLLAACRAFSKLRNMHWLRRHRLLILAAICAFWAGAILLVRTIPGVPFLTFIWTSEQSFEDLLQREGRKTATRPDFVFLGIDQSTLELPPLEPEELYLLVMR